MSAATPRGTTAEEVAAGVAHDFNNVLTVISGNLALAERHAAGNPKLIRLLNNIRLAAERASDLTGELMNVATVKPPGGLVGKVDAAVEKPAKILVVEDDPDVAEVAVAVLESMGHDVRMCANASAALSVLEESAAFDLVFSDIMMPGPMNGIDLAEAILKRFPRFAGAFGHRVQQRGPGSGCPAFSGIGEALQRSGTHEACGPDDRGRHLATDGFS